MNASLCVEHLHHHFLVGATANPNDDWRCSTHKGAFIINDFIRNPPFNFTTACLDNATFFNNF
jgi:hypothetical protein